MNPSVQMWRYSMMTQVAHIHLHVCQEIFLMGRVASFNFCSLKPAVVGTKQDGCQSQSCVRDSLLYVNLVQEGAKNVRNVELCH